MNLSIRDNTIYADNLKLCLCEAGNGRPNLPHGRYEVATQFSHVHGRILPDAIDLGWIGAARGCDIILGGVRGRNGLIPSKSHVGRLVALLEVAEGRGQSPMLEVRK